VRRGWCLQECGHQLFYVRFYKNGYIAKFFSGKNGSVGKKSCIFAAEIHISKEIQEYIGNH
jgi:hypothetical protein